MNFDGWARSLKLLFLEGVSVGGSILLIALFSGIPFCRRRMHREDALTLYGLYRVFALTARREALRKK